VGATVSGPVRRLPAEPPTFPDRSVELTALVGREAGAPQLSPDAVNAPMIRHWVEAMGDTNPIYVSDEAARAYGHEGLVAPPAMLQAWIMRGLRDTQVDGVAKEAGLAQAAGGPETDGGPHPYATMSALLDEEGLTGVRGTNCMQHYGRSLMLGDRLLARTFIESISDPTQTRLGPGRFVSTRVEFTAVPDAGVPEAPSPSEIAALAAAGDPVAIMRFRILRYRPSDGGPGPGPDAGAGVGVGAGEDSAGVARPLRPRPAITRDNAFWFDGARAHRLLIQRCASCGTLRHPPLPACGACQSLEWDTLEASGRGVLYSFVVVHHPQVEPFDYPLPVGLVELEEGARVVANLDGILPGELRIGVPLVATFVDYDAGLSLPVFVPEAAAPGSGPGAAGGAD
jgi:uncharacterized protein